MIQTPENEKDNAAKDIIIRTIREIMFWLSVLRSIPEDPLSNISFYKAR